MGRAGWAAGRPADLSVRGRRHWIDAVAGRASRRPRCPGGSHPLLGERVEIAGSGVLWRSELSLVRQPWIADHRIHGQVLFPMTAYLAMMTAASGGALADIVLLEPLVVGDDDIAVQTVSRTGSGRFLQSPG